VAFEYTVRMTITGQSVDDALFAQLKQHYSEAHIVELTAAIALETSAANSTRPSASKHKAFAFWRAD
jgi:alkylhydroperoxidase family enzyme